ncbi:hypothetical protein [Wenyingzhuangia sp. 2_MG-2023]|uniref:hypothetical protein n=1 Tax=Wenyingzhuangia sp. 2_MG-2023 TaxID=3062639 RepID=UPI0026E47F41|nr:hypothetical protein [Wenyingzhuangia sp. 2_MG-2023]MDO6737348.1 hypothetical protein [Wenyingzhuangia sp. 2_MG-2023]
MSKEKSNKGCGIVALIIFIIALVMFMPRWYGSKSVDGFGEYFLYFILQGVVLVGVIYFYIKIKDGEF